MEFEIENDAKVEDIADITLTEADVEGITEYIWCSSKCSCSILDSW